MKIQPLDDKVFVKRLEDELISESGLFIPEIAKKRNMVATVTAVGPGKPLKDGTRRRPEVEIGCKVLLAKYDGTFLDVEGERFIILREDEILAIVA